MKILTVNNEKASGQSFYSAFENAYRGSFELIKARLSVYLPFINLLKNIHPKFKAVDLGSGRGEWLELLKDLAVEGSGVEQNDEMHQLCQKQGLNVVKNDAIQYLKSLPAESLLLVSGFHFIEHISFSDLQIVIQEALRVLKPGGLLILETPNPENIIVGTSSFYLDPTHRRPIPPLLLEFTTLHYGFHRSRVLRLQESNELVLKEEINLTEVLTGVSPDYSVIAQKKSIDEHLLLFDSLFAKEYGTTIKSLATRFDARLTRMEQRLQQAEQRLQQAEQRNQQAEQRCQQAEQQIRMYSTSRSWRITAPLRALGSVFRNLVERFKN